MLIAILIALTVLTLILILVGFSQIVAVAAGAPIIASDETVIKEVLKIARPKPGEKLIDLGCGWGRVLRIAQRRGLNAEGVDISPVAVLWNRLWGRKIKFGDVRKVNLENYDIIYTYLLPKLVAQIDFSSTQKGARIIAIDFPVPGWKPVKTKKVGRHTIYLYRAS